jgi:hypothetical protein
MSTVPADVAVGVGGAAAAAVAAAEGGPGGC